MDLTSIGGLVRSAFLSLGKHLICYQHPYAFQAVTKVTKVVFRCHLHILASACLSCHAIHGDKVQLYLCHNIFVSSERIPCNACM